MQRIPVAPRPSRFRRAGATLIEVLMSLLILAIGVVPIFTLFPISLLSSIQSNQLTTARLYAEQVKARVTINPEMVLGAKSWQPVTTYGNGDVVTPTIGPDATTPPNRFYYYKSGGSSGSSGPKEPMWNSFEGRQTTETVGSDSITWTTTLLPVNQVNTPFVPSRYVVDPYGKLFAETGAIGFRFGNNNGAPMQQQAVLRINGGVTTESQAYQYGFCSPDTWNVVETLVPRQVFTEDTSGGSVANSTRIVFDSSVDMTTFPRDPNQQQGTRIVLVSSDGRRSGCGLVTANALNDSTLNSNEVRVAGGLLAPSPSPANISTLVGQARIEVYERRYTWLGAVQREVDGSARVQCAIFFNRSFRLTDEQLYNYQQGIDLDQAMLDWSATPSLEPFLVQGGWAFDARSVAFYRIVNVTKTSGTSATINVFPPLDPEGGGPAKMIFMPGIVHVYELEL